MDLPKSVVSSKTQLEQLVEHLGSLKESSNNFLTQDFREIIEELSSLEGAKLQVAIAFTLASLFYIKMNVCGKDLVNHPIHDELNRVKSFVSQLNQREKMSKTAASNENEEKESNPTKRPKLNTGAASRIIKHHT